MAFRDGDAGEWIATANDAAPSSRRFPSAVEDLIPSAAFCVRETIVVARSPAVVYQAIRGLRSSEMPLARALCAIRMLGATELGRDPVEPTLADKNRRFGWVVVADVPSREVAAGIVAKLWCADLGVRRVRGRDELVAFDEPGFAKLVFGQRLEAVRDGTLVTAEARAAATDPGAERKLRWCWATMGPLARLALRSLLSAEARRAQRARA